MHCPSCGNESSIDQKFCRKCGFNLEPVGKLFGNDSTTEELKLERAERERQAVRRMVSWLMWGLLVMLIGVILIVINKQFKVDDIVKLIGSLLTLGGISVATYGLLDAMRGGKGPHKRKEMEPSWETTPDAEFKAHTTRELEGRTPIPVPSVTERTTQLIAEEIRKQ